jgi:hypothetical protein
VADEQRLRDLYVAFNDRNVDSVLAAMTEDVDWPNAWEGGRLRGQAAVREYWTRQWAQIDPRVEAGRIEVRPDGRLAVDVHQVVHDRNGKLLAEGHVRHVYRFRDGLVAEMRVEEPPAA